MILQQHPILFDLRIRPHRSSSGSTAAFLACTHLINCQRHIPANEIVSYIGLRALRVFSSESNWMTICVEEQKEEAIALIAYYANNNTSDRLRRDVGLEQRRQRQRRRNQSDKVDANTQTRSLTSSSLRKCQLRSQSSSRNSVFPPAMFFQSMPPSFLLLNVVIIAVFFPFFSEEKNDNDPA